MLGRGTGVRVQAESHLELSHLFLLNASFSDLREQVRFRYGAGDVRTHVFDAVYVTDAGQRIACTIKPERKLASGGFLEEMQTIAWWVRKKSFADDVRLLTDADVDPILLHNAKLFAAVREADTEADEAARRASATILGAVNLRDLVARTGLEARGYRALLRLLRDGALRLVRNERITPVALVQPRGAR